MGSSIGLSASSVQSDRADLARRSATSEIATPGDRTSAPTAYHTVRAGETLSQIARRYGTTWQTLARINRLDNANLIVVGQQLRLPGRAIQYIVRPGDTLSQIAQRTGSDVRAIARDNRLADVDRIMPGQRLRIVPGAARAAAPPAPSSTAPADRATPVLTPAAPVTRAGTIDLDRFLDPSRGSASPAAIIIGNAEGTRTPDGGTTRAYRGHIDPGNAASNRGSFSLQGAGNATPDQADRIQLARLGAMRPRYEAAARAAGLDPANAVLATGYFDLHNQSPTAAVRFLRQLNTLSSSAITPQSIAELRFHSFVDRTTGQRFPGAGGGFVTIARANLGRTPSEAEVHAVIRADQTRRVMAMQRAMSELGVGSVGVVPSPAHSPAPGPVAPSQGSETPRFAYSRGIDLSPATIRQANALAQRVAAATGYHIHVTSGRRDPARQAAAMYDNYADNSAPSYRNRTAEAEVRAAYVSGRRAGLDRAETIARMAAVLQRQVSQGIYLSRHMRDGAIDIRTPPASVVAAIRSDPSVRSAGMEDDHLHVEFR